MNWAQKLYKLLRPKNLTQYGQAMPLFNIFYISKLNRYHAMKTLIIVFGIIPLIGYFRQPYMRSKFHKQLSNQSESKEIQLKESLSKFEITIPSQQEYMVIISYSSFDDEKITQQDQELCRKIYTLFQEKNKLGVAGEEIKWVFFGNENIYGLLKEGGFDMEFHNINKIKKQAKVYLVGRDQQGDQKVVTQWDIGVPMQLITKSISKHRYKKYVQSVNF